MRETMTKGTKRKSKKDAVEQPVVAQEIAPVVPQPTKPAQVNSTRPLPPAKRLLPQNLLAELDSLAAAVEFLKSEIAELKSKL